ncbi:MAG: hypothetical protein WA734_13340 [Candidatus Acidiferrales bacterium]
MRKAFGLSVLAFASFIVAGLTQSSFAQSSAPSPAPDAPDASLAVAPPPAPNAAEPTASGPLSPLPSSRPAYRRYPRLGVGVSVSPLGIDIEAAEPLSPTMNVRAGFNTFGHSDTVQINGITYNAQLNLHSVEALVDWYPRPRFHLSPGLLLYNDNQLAAQASVPGGQIFTLSGVSYMSMPTDPVSGTAKLDFFKLSPMILAGFGNLAPRNGKHFSFRFEFGGVYQGTPHVQLNLAGGDCNPDGTNCNTISMNPTVQSALQSIRQTIRRDASHYGLFPIIKIGIAFVI